MNPLLKLALMGGLGGAANGFASDWSRFSEAVKSLDNNTKVTWQLVKELYNPGLAILRMVTGFGLGFATGLVGGSIVPGTE